MQPFNDFTTRRQRLNLPSFWEELATAILAILTYALFAIIILAL